MRGPHDAVAAEVFEVISPHTEQSIAELAAAGPADVDAAVNAARINAPAL